MEKFVRQYISSAVRAVKEAELLALKQGDVSVVAYESQFISLLHFSDNMFQTEEHKARMLERGLRPKIRKYIVAQKFDTLREVTNAAITHEFEFTDAQKGKETATRVTKQEKGKRTFAAVGLGEPPQKGTQQGGQLHEVRKKKNILGNCRNCGRSGHKIKDCRQSRAGPDRQGGRGLGQMQ